MVRYVLKSNKLSYTVKFVEVFWRHGQVKVKRKLIDFM